MRVGHDWCRQVDVHAPCLMRAFLGWCHLILVDIVSHVRTSDASRPPPMTARVLNVPMPWSMSSSWLAHVKFDTRTPWLISRAIEHIQVLMCVGHVQCSLTSSDVVFHMRTCYSNSYKIGPMLFSTGQYAQATTFIEKSMRIQRIWLINPLDDVPDIGRHYLLYVHFRYVQPMTDVSRRWPMCAYHDLYRSANAHMKCFMHASDVTGCCTNTTFNMYRPWTILPDTS